MLELLANIHSIRLHQATGERGIQQPRCREAAAAGLPRSGAVAEGKRQPTQRESTSNAGDADAAPAAELVGFPVSAGSALHLALRSTSASACAVA